MHTIIYKMQLSVQLMHFVQTFRHWKAVSANTNGVHALKLPSEWILPLVKRPLAVPWFPRSHGHCHIFNHQVLNRVRFITHDDTRRNEWILNANVSQRDICKRRAALRWTVSIARQRIREWTFATKCCIWLVLLLWSNPYGPPKGMFHVHVFVAKLNQ